MLNLILRVADAELADLSRYGRVEVEAVGGLWVLLGHHAACGHVSRLALLGRERDAARDFLARRAAFLLDSLAAALTTGQPVLDIRALTVPWTEADLEVLARLDAEDDDGAEDETYYGPPPDQADDEHP